MILPTTTPQVSRIARPRHSSSLSFTTPAKVPAGPVSHSRSQSSFSSGVPSTPVTTGGVGGSSNLLNTSKKYKALLSTESKPRNVPFPRSKAPLPTVPGSPKTPSRPNSRTGKRPESVCSGPGTWGRTTPSLPLFGSSAQLSEMDVSNVDPEDVLVDSHTVEPGDVSGELASGILDPAYPAVDDEGANDAGKHDKVMVSVRIKGSSPSSNAGNEGKRHQHCHAGAWTYAPETNTIILNPAFTKHPQLFSSPSPSSPSPDSPSLNSSSSFVYDSILTGRSNKPIYTRTARSHVLAAMEGYNAVIFAYGQTASGKTYTLSGDEGGDEPGIIPRAMKDVFATIKRTSDREYLLRCSYLEIYNETIFDLLAPPSIAAANPVQIQGSGSLFKGGNSDVILAPLREEVVTSLKGVKEVLRRGESNRRTACTDWNERSSRSHSVFRMVIESREKDESVAARQKRIEEEEEDKEDEESVAAALLNTGMGGRRTPGLSNGRQTPGFQSQLGGPRLQARGGKSVRTSVLSLIDLAGSEKATSDKERTREGKYINTSLLTLGTVIGTLADNTAKKKSDYVPYRNSKLTRLLQPSLSGNARISVICTINPDPGAISESTSTLLFAKRIKNVKLNAQKKEVVDTDALIERYKKEIEDLKQRLAEREQEAEVHARSRRLSTKEKADESKSMKDLNARIQQLTKLILTSQTVDDIKADDSRPASPVKVDFDMSPYQLQQELLNAKNQIESQATQILALEEALLARPLLPPSASEKDALIAAQNKTIRELEIVVRGYEDNLGEPLRKVKEDVEREWIEKVEEEKRKKEEKERWAEELVTQLDRERRARRKLEEERKALAAFVSKFDSLGLGTTLSPLPGSAAASIATAAVALKTPTKSGGGVKMSPVVVDRNKLKKADECEKENAVEESFSAGVSALSEMILPLSATPSPMKMDWLLKGHQYQLQGPTMLLMEQMPEEVALCGDLSFEGAAVSPGREVFGGKENVV